jgi:hypothetical protein
VSRLAGPATRLAAGSVAVARRLGDRVFAWVRRGRREDLDGWRAALGCWLRLIVLVLGVYLLYRLVRAVPVLLWLFSASWTIAAWRAGKAVLDASEDTDGDSPEEALQGSPAEVVRGLLLEVMGDADTVHLNAVLAHLQKRGQWEGRTVTDLRARLTLLDIPHDRSVKVGRVPTWGVRRRDLQAPSPAAAQEASPSPSTAA